LTAKGSRSPSYRACGLESQEKSRGQSQERGQEAEEEKKKKRTMEYFQQLRDEVLEEEAALLQRAEGSQATRSKHKEVTAEDEEGQWPSKKAREKQPGKYRGGAAVKMGVLLPVRGVCALGRIAWCTPQGE